ncbi:acetate/propionate family kinase [Aquabacterium sp. A7-Y]|uniref:acetate/propionate family kinase n=1 Tax=Aquabacterium sp. A7-Y TaxID=1349605 RepID=UPI00223DBAFE|nr:acetate/propionate family kinase [Aquabacterium sp. A7-Y]MCW7538541.1 acetate/propionate family kinase [Aquabacterium sp. A7-Y]
MPDLILVLNAGSSSIKFSAFGLAEGQLEVVLRGQIEGLYAAPQFTVTDRKGAMVAMKAWPRGTVLGHDGSLAYLAQFLRSHLAGYDLRAAGHRVAHGGMNYHRSAIVTPKVSALLEKLVPLAPLHQPHNLKSIDILAKLRPDLLQVACFDTGFHRVQPEAAQAFALPASITDAGVRRYGFHGLSYEYIASVLPDFDPKAASGRSVVAHLGSGSSMCAMVGGYSVATTMGFSALDGLPMGTRSGCVDPGVILYLLNELKMDPRAIEDLLYRRSGLLGVSGLSSDMRVLLASDDARARFAVDLYVYRIGRELGSLAAAAHGIDTLVFTAGIGERAALIRERVCQNAAWLGVDINPSLNQTHGPRIHTSASKVAVWVIPTDEELVIARHTRELLQTVEGSTK